MRAAPLLLLAGCATSLEARLDARLAPLDARGATVSYLVEDLATGEVLAEREADRLLAPASTQKLLTTAALFCLTDTSTSLTTRLYGPPIADGVAAGDLVLVGAGDPSFGAARFGRDAIFATLAAELRAGGLTRITGELIGDERALPARLGAAWSWDDAALPYSARPSALVFGEAVESATLRRKDGAIETRLGSPALALTATSAEPGRFSLEPAPSGGVVARWGGGEGETKIASVAVSDPARHAAERLRAALIAEGIEVGPARSGARDPVRAPETWRSWVSPPLAALAVPTNVESQNLYAELLLVQLGRLAGRGASTASGAEVLRAHLAALGVRDATIVDGSGLSRMNLLSARALVRVLAEVLIVRPDFAETLAVAGVSGTMKPRLANTALAGRVRAKTGSLTGHRNLAGVLEAPDGRRILFAIMASGTVVPRGEIDAFVDAALLEIAE